MDPSELIADIEQKYIPLRKQASLAYWNGSITGNEDEYRKYAEANIRITDIFSDPQTFRLFRTFKQSPDKYDALLNRQIQVYYDAFLANQADLDLLNEITQKESSLEQRYSGFRAPFGDRSIDDNTIEDILRKSLDNAELEEVWKAHKLLGREVSASVLELVRLRNRVAAQLGFDNYHTMSLRLSGQDPQVISTLFDELDEMTATGYARLKAEMDLILSRRYGVPADALMPWHYQGRFLQEAPDIYPLDLDRYYRGRSLEQLTADFYTGIGLDVHAVLEHSDLYPRERKNQHAYCIDIDGAGDVRVLSNNTDNEQWMGTMLHEFGHSVYALGHDAADLPYSLKESAHIFTTEAVAMMFGRLSRNPQWMRRMLHLSAEETDAISENCRRSMRLQQLVFSRWVQVVYRFEKSMYENPGQDLNELWWRLEERYQLLKRPEGRNEPDWAAKIHIALYPCYYHNYQLGELLASQLHYYIAAHLGCGDAGRECYVGNPAVGRWLEAAVFSSGMRYEWNEMIERATGEKLTPAYYRRQFVD